jgi:hypothetical protein
VTRFIRRSPRCGWCAGSRGSWSADGRVRMKIERGVNPRLFAGDSADTPLQSVAGHFSLGSAANGNQESVFRQALNHRALRTVFSEAEVNCLAKSQGERLVAQVFLTLREHLCSGDQYGWLRVGILQILSGKHHPITKHLRHKSHEGRMGQTGLCHKKLGLMRLRARRQNPCRHMMGFSICKNG